MLQIPDLAKELIEKGKIESQSAQKKKWDRERAWALDYYKDRAEEDYMRFIDEDLRESLPIPSNNITKRVTDRTSLVYMVPPIRTLGDPEAEYDMTKYNEVTRMKDIQLPTAEKRTNLLGLIGTKLTWRDGMIHYDRLIQFEPYFEEDNPWDPVAVVFPIAPADTVADDRPERWQYWDKDVWATYEGGQKVDDGENEYGVIPIVWTYVELPDGSFLDADIDRGLVYSNRELNVLQLDGDANIRFRSYGEMWASGLNDETKLRRAQNVIHALPEGSSINTTSPKDTISSIKDWIKQIYIYVAQNHHLTVDFVEQTVSASGVALKERNRELNDDRKGDVERWRLAEHNFYKIERKIVKVEAQVELPEEFAVDFNEAITEELSVDDQIKQDTWDLEHNQITEAQILMRGNSDKYKTIEDAQAAVEENRTTNVSTNAPIPTLSNALAVPVDEVEEV